MLLTVNKLNAATITGVIGTEKYSVAYTSDLYNQLTDLETQFSTATTIADAKSIVDAAKTAITTTVTEATEVLYGGYLKLDEKSQRYFLKSNGIVSSIPIPKVLANKIVEAIDKQLDYLPFVKAWMWFLKNPNFSKNKAKYFANYITTTFVDAEQYAKLIEEGYSVEKATELSTFNDVSITKNGLLSTYKYAQIKYKKFDGTTGEYVDRYPVIYDEETGKANIQLPEEAEAYYLIPPIMGERGDAFSCGADLGHKIQVGNIHALPDWSMVDCTDGASCLKGLHLGGLSYIKGYGGRGNLLLNCFVNPMHIGALTDASGDSAIRVKEYFVHSAEFAPNKALYHESTYLEHTQSQWEEMRAEAIASSEAKIKSIKGLQDEINAL